MNRRTKHLEKAADAGRAPPLLWLPGLLAGLGCPLSLPRNNPPVTLGPREPPAGLCFPTRMSGLHTRGSHNLRRMGWGSCGGAPTSGTGLKAGTPSLPWPDLRGPDQGRERPGAQHFPHILRDSPPTPSPLETPTFSFSPDTFPDLPPPTTKEVCVLIT